VTVGVVAEQRMVVIHDQRVDRARAVGALGERIRQVRRRFLVWYGHVQPAASAREELQHLRAEVLGRYVVEAIDQELFGLLGEQSVDERRPAVVDRMTDHAILIRYVRC
jgi:hypothetical protein